MNLSPELYISEYVFLMKKTYLGTQQGCSLYHYSIHFWKFQAL